VSSNRVQVLYVLGMYRSGTTLLGNLAGQLDGYCSVGELRSVWRKSTLPGVRCGCGARLSECPVWSAILGSALGEGEQRTALAREMRHCQREAVGEFHTWLRVPSLLRRRGSALPAGSALARYAEGLGRMYRAVAAQTGATVIVDSSKEPTDAALLLLMPDVDATFVQIVRDPRGTVNSVLRAREKGAGDKDRPAGSRKLLPSFYTSLSWSAGNLAAAAVRRSAGPDRSMLLRYEDFVAQPAAAIESLARMAGRPAQFPASAEPGTVHMQVAHTVGGNDNRFRAGPVQLREDTTWRSELRPLNRAAITAACAPLMARYGYRLARGATPATARPVTS